MKNDFSYIFEWAFRPFFVLGSLFLIISLVYWLFVLKGIGVTPEVMSASDWHAHEMIFGFGSAALSGFLLTAIPSWTNTPHVEGRRLMLLVCIWLLSRLFMAFADTIALGMVISVNIAFPLYLFFLICSPLWNDLEKKHIVFIFVLGLFLMAQTSTYLGWLGLGENIELSRLSLYGAMYVLVYAIIVTSSRISMVVVRLALDEQDDKDSLFRPYPFRRNLAAATFLFFAIMDLILPETPILGWFALAAGAAQLDRLSDFHVGRVILKPYVLLVYLANFWIGMGCIAMGLNVFFDLDASSDIRHLFATGAMLTAILSVFTIAGLRHSGLALIVPKRVTVALICLVFATVLRFLPALPIELIPHDVSYDGAAFFVILAFGLYLSRFYQILLIQKL